MGMASRSASSIQTELASWYSLRTSFASDGLASTSADGTSATRISLAEINKTIARLEQELTLAGRGRYLRTRVEGL